MLGVENSVRSRTSFGGTAPKNVRAQARLWLRRLKKEEPCKTRQERSWVKRMDTKWVELIEHALTIIAVVVAGIWTITQLYLLRQRELAMVSYTRMRQSFEPWN